MKKTRKTSKARLALSRQTLRMLSPEQLGHIAGGDTNDGPSLLTCLTNCSCAPPT